MSGPQGRIDAGADMCVEEGPEPKPVFDDRRLIAAALYAYARTLDDVRKALGGDMLYSVAQRSVKDASRARVLAAQFAPSTRWMERGSKG